MATCYVCGKEHSSFRRYVHTGISQRYGYSSRGGSTSTTNHYGPRTVCSRCALQIDYSNKKSSALAIIYIGIPIGLFLLLFSKTLGFVVIVGCFIVGILLRISVTNWYSENKENYIDTYDFEKNISKITTVTSSKENINLDSTLKTGKSFINRGLKEIEIQQIKTQDFINIVKEKADVIKSKTECDELVEYCEEFSNIATKWKNKLLKELDELEHLYKTIHVTNSSMDSVINSFLDVRMGIINTANSEISIANDAISQILSQKIKFDDNLTVSENIINNDFNTIKSIPEDFFCSIAENNSNNKYYKLLLSSYVKVKSVYILKDTVSTVEIDQLIIFFKEIEYI